MGIYLGYSPKGAQLLLFPEKTKRISFGPENGLDFCCGFAEVRKVHKWILQHDVSLIATLSPIIMVQWNMGAWKMTLVSFWGPFSTSMIMGGGVFLTYFSFWLNYGNQFFGRKHQLWIPRFCFLLKLQPFVWICLFFF